MNTTWKLHAAIALLIVPLVSFGAQGDSDYSVNEVRELLKQPAGFSSGFSEKQLNRLGDRISIALMKMYTKDDLTNPAIVKRYLPLMVGAFQFPNLVPANDREPRVTLVFLQFVQDHVRDKDLKAEISKTRETVISETASRK